MGINKVILVGNLGKDPEIKTLESGVKVASFSIATSENYTDKNSGERKSVTEWHNVVAWRNLADIAEKYLIKGKQVYLEGKIKTRKWEDQNNNTRYTTEVIADSFQMLGRKDDNDITTHSPNMDNTSNNLSKLEKKETDLGEDDLPF